MTAAMLTERDREALADVLGQFAENIERVDVFGSRATGAARSNSDIDLVVYGDLDEKAERRLWTLLEDSNLPLSVDLVVYSRIKNDLLREHVDAVGSPLFTRQDLRRRRRNMRR